MTFDVTDGTNDFMGLYYIIKKHWLTRLVTVNCHTNFSFLKLLATSGYPIMRHHVKKKISCLCQCSWFLWHVAVECFFEILEQCHHVSIILYHYLIMLNVSKNFRFRNKSFQYMVKWIVHFQCNFYFQMSRLWKKVAVKVQLINRCMLQSLLSS